MPLTPSGEAGTGARTSATPTPSLKGRNGEPRTAVVLPQRNEPEEETRHECESRLVKDPKEPQLGKRLAEEAALTRQRVQAGWPVLRAIHELERQLRWLLRRLPLLRALAQGVDTERGVVEVVDVLSQKLAATQEKMEE